MFYTCNSVMLYSLVLWKAINNFSFKIIIISLKEFLQRIHIKWVRDFGGIYRLWIGNRPVVIISSPQLMEVKILNAIYSQNRYSIA